ncbi:uncharacterized protein N7515_007454 [Penicillium bovifimosum]|uniref:FAD dependent oxidoreductase n=1 Tax=Penicillium bovifimosum TaxID=126998 RepID=A0A9W9GWN1_9EURO|nr:uncharacterized protein N7515_007454 [Penicillium bovifimosum]KAJ5131415.1 hypothetical protein N7515_007454 [Penicillium bovifimosum]
MQWIQPSSILVAYGIAILACHGRQFDPLSYAPNEVIDVDVAIIGGGATGSYAAITLADLNWRVAVVEATGILGGQANTYIDPATNIPIDYGVQRYGKTTGTLAFFKRLGVTYTDHVSSAANTMVYTDFTTGQPLQQFSPSANFSGYLQQLRKYPYLLYTTNIPDPIPADFALAFADFIRKYNLQDVAFEIAAGFGPSLLNTPVLNVITETGLEELSLDATNTVDIEGGNSQIYMNALAKIGSSHVLFNSTISAAQREGSSSIRFVVDTPTGNRLIQAKRALVTVPTTLTNMAPFDLDARERDIFSRFWGPGLWVGLVTVSGLPAGTRYTNVGTNTSYHIPTLPAVTVLTPTAVSGIYRFEYWDNDLSLSIAEANARSLAIIRRFAKQVAPYAHGQPEMVAFNSHAPFKVGLTEEAIAQNYWNKMYALQGHRNTWYTGVQFLPGSSQLWNYTATMIPDIVAGL